MMKKILWFLMLAAGFVFVACSDDDDSYDADAAVSNYKPVQGDKKVASLYTTNVIEGREYAWKHNFEYDKQGRIKEVRSEIKHHRPYSQTVTGEVKYQLCNITSNAKYYYYGERLEVEYTVNREYPQFPKWNSSYSRTDGGVLNENGHIVNFVQPPYEGLDCEYSLMSLKNVVFDGEKKFEILRDNNGNINGHKFWGYDSEGNDSTSVKQNRYSYTWLKNKTNFDFSAYIGYWEHERFIDALSSWPYASYQLAAFGFFGSCSPYLPKCEAASLEGGVSDVDFWTMKDGYPVQYKDADGRVTLITYVE